MMIQQLFRATSTAILLLLSLESTAVTEYEFDVILFQDVRARDAYWSEHHQRPPSQRNADTPHPEEMDQRLIDLSMIDDLVTHYIERDSGVLDDAESTLTRSSRYALVDRRTWRIHSPVEGSTVSLKIGEQDGSGAGSFMLTTDTTRPALRGSIDFLFSRFIHLSTNLQIDDQTSGEQIVTPSTARPKPVEIVLERKLRSNETHYIDHPLLGIVIRISRVERPSPEPEAS